MQNKSVASVDEKEWRKNVQRINYHCKKIVQIGTRNESMPEGLHVNPTSFL